MKMTIFARTSYLPKFYCFVSLSLWDHLRFLILIDARPYCHALVILRCLLECFVLNHVAFNLLVLEGNRCVDDKATVNNKAR